VKIEELEQLAHHSIARFNNSSLPKLPGKEAVVQFGQYQPIPKNFPIAAEYLGCNQRGFHIYNIPAKAILQYCDRYRSEFKASS
jgi:hypothetical protein